MRDNKGFTLIELLIVVVIIGILAAIAIPKFSATREKAYVAAMKSDLKNIASQQEMYYAGPGQYAYATGGDAGLTALGASLSQGVTLVGLTGNNTSYVVEVEHGGLPGESCAVAYGEETNPVLASAASGLIVCTNNR